MAFAKGISGNPGGKPKELKGIQELARKYAPQAIEALVKVATKGKSEAARVTAATVLLDRGFGKPNQSVSGPDGHPLLPPVINLIGRPEPGKDE